MESSQETPQQQRQRLQQFQKVAKEAKELYKKYLARGNTPEEARVLTIEGYQVMAQTKNIPPEVAHEPQKELLEENKIQQYQMGKQEKIDQIQMFETMAKIQLKEVALQEYRRMQEEKTLQHFIRHRAESMIELMEMLMKQGSNKIEAREVVTQYYIVEM